jgi:sterol desaturase/sphingolipid hydroxylase (fatty acid hydroxylase superfamily)
MPETRLAEGTKVESAPVVLRSRVLLTAGWVLLILSLALLAFHVLWMWKRMGRGAPLVGIGLVMDALVGVGLMIAANRTRRTQ